MRKFNSKYEEFNSKYEEFNFKYEEFTIGTICNRDNSLNVSKSESITFKELSLFIQRIVPVYSKICLYLFKDLPLFSFLLRAGISQIIKGIYSPP